MRVLTFVHSFELGGVERIAIRLVQRWRALGIEAPLFVGRDEGDMREDIAGDLEFMLPRQPPFPPRAWETLWMILTLPRAIRKARPDVLFCAGNSYTVVAVAMKLLLGRNCPPILAKISNSLDRDEMPGWWRRAYRIWLRTQGLFLDHLVGMEAPMVREIAEALSIPEDRVTIIPDPALSEALIAELRAQRPISRPPERGQRFVAIGRLTAQKNFALMLRAFRRGARDDDSLVIMGDGPERAKLVNLACALNLEDRVELRGFVANPAALLPDFDVCLLSSDYEGVPAAVLEAIAAGLPVIATDCSRSMNALLGGGRLGRLVTVGDESALVAAIRTSRSVETDETLSLAQAQRFTIERAGDLYLQTMQRRLIPGEHAATCSSCVPPRPLSIEKISA